MQIEVFSIPMTGDPSAVEGLNTFLRSHKVLAIDRVAVTDEGGQFWSVFMRYQPVAAR